jgi:hypothetical protein
MRIPTHPRRAAVTSDHVGVHLAGGGHADAAVASSARMAGWSGLVFAGLLVASLVLVSRMPGLADPDTEYSAFYSDGGGDALSIVGLYLVPFAGIACLWHMLATRTLLQVQRPSSWTEVPHWLHLAACVLFICMLFAGSAAAGAVAFLTRFSDAPLPGPDVARGLSAVGYTLVFVFGVRAAGMYIITTTGLARSAGVLPGAVVVLSYLVAVFLLLSATSHPAILLVFPAWVLVISTVLLVRRPTGAIP